MVEQTEHKELVPRLRFRGFTEPWRQRKLKDELAEIIAGGDVDRDKLQETGSFPVIANAVNSDGIVGYYDSTFRVKAPAVTVTGRGEVGIATVREVNFTPVVRLLSITSSHDVYFLANAINNVKIINESTGVPQLTTPQLRNIMLSFSPYSEEERKIGEFFKNINSLITAYEQEYELLQSKKNYYLQKVLSNYLSFESDPDRWQERKFNEIFQAVSVKGFPDLPVLSASQDLGMVYRDQLDTDIKFNKHSLAGYKRVSAGDFVISLRSFQGGFEYSTITGICSPAYTVFRFIKPNEHDPLFWKVVFKSPHFIELLKTVTFGIRDGKAISFSDVGTLRLQVPSFDEQKQIGVFFETLNNLLCAVQNKIELLQKKKKYYLQNMFI